MIRSFRNMDTEALFDDVAGQPAARVAPRAPHHGRTPGLTSATQAARIPG